MKRISSRCFFISLSIVLSIFVIFTTSVIFSNIITVESITVQSDRNTPVESRIFIYKGQPKDYYSDNPIAYVDTTGFNRNLKYECVLGDYLVAVPRDNTDYKNSSPLVCKASMAFKVPNRDWKNQKLKPDLDRKIKNLSSALAEVSAKKDYGSEALIYTELSQRIKPYDKISSVDFALMSFTATGRVFGVEKPTIFDENQGKYVISPDLYTKIKSFQVDNKIMGEGRLNYATLSRISSIQPYQMLYIDQFTDVNSVYNIPNMVSPSDIVKIPETTKGTKLTNLLRNARKYDNNREYEKSALIWSEIFSQAKMQKLKWANSAEVNLYNSTYNALRTRGLANYEPTQAAVFDPIQGGFVMSHQLKGSVVEFQKKNQLSKKSGKLDYTTLRFLADDELRNIQR